MLYTSQKRNKKFNWKWGFTYLTEVKYLYNFLAQTANCYATFVASHTCTAAKQEQEFEQLAAHFAAGV
jgi:hypothetical protein